MERYSGIVTQRVIKYSLKRTGSGPREKGSTPGARQTKVRSTHLVIPYHQAQGQCSPKPEALVGARRYGLGAAGAAFIVGCPRAEAASFGDLWTFMIDERQCVSEAQLLVSEMVPVAAAEAQGLWSQVSMRPVRRNGVKHATAAEQLHVRMRWEQDPRTR
jgi:hypothetical protein